MAAICTPVYAMREKNITNAAKIMPEEALFQGRIGIEHREKIVDEKSRIGDFEVDTVIGAGHKGAIVTIVDKASKFLLCEILPSKEEKLVSQSIISLLASSPNPLHTLTFDNGKEFAGHEKIAKSLDAKCYFANPYCSWERGLNEHTNGLLRQFIPKKPTLIPFLQKN